jgi:hypothetical protein
MQERRKEPRKPLMAYTQVFDLYGGRLLGYLGDITLMGAMVIGDRPNDTGQLITLAVELPELPDIKSSRIVIPSRTAWCEQDISPNFFNVGFEFLEIKPDQAEIIKAIVKRYEFRRTYSNYPIKPSASSK